MISLSVIWPKKDEFASTDTRLMVKTRQEFVAQSVGMGDRYAQEWRGLTAGAPRISRRERTAIRPPGHADLTQHHPIISLIRTPKLCVVLINLSSSEDAIQMLSPSPSSECGDQGWVKHSPNFSNFGGIAGRRMRRDRLLW